VAILAIAGLVIFGESLASFMQLENLAGSV
jgi:hypothetical protein